MTNGSQELVTAQSNNLSEDKYYLFKVNLVEKTANGYDTSTPIFSGPISFPLFLNDINLISITKLINSLFEKNILTIGDGDTQTDYAWIGVKNEYGQTTWAGPGDLLMVNEREVFVIPYKVSKSLLNLK